MKKCIYALDAGGSYLKCGLVGEDMRVIPDTRDAEAADSEKGTPGEVRASYAALAARAKVRAARMGYEIVAVGMDTPGPFDYASGTFRMTHKYTALYGVSVLPWFGEDFPGVPINIIHDSAAFILGAAHGLYGANGCKDRSIAAVMLGTGLGFALMRDGSPLLAPGGGPLVSIYRAPLCGVEAEELISARGIVRRYAESSRDADKSISAKEVALRAKAGDAAAARAYADTGRLLGELIAPVLAEHSVDTLLLGGQISRDAPLFMLQLRTALEGRGFCVDILPAPNGDDAHLLGAAMGAQALLK